MVGSGIGARRDEPDATGLEVLVFGFFRERYRDAVADDLAVLSPDPIDLRAERFTAQSAAGRHLDLRRAIQRNSLLFPLVDGLRGDPLAYGGKRLSQCNRRMEKLQEKNVSHGSD